MFEHEFIFDLTLLMGNTFSRNIPLRESLFRLEEQIAGKEKNVKRLKAKLKDVGGKIWMISITGAVMSAVYAYLDDQSIMLFSVCSVVLCHVVKYLLVCLYETRIEALEAALEALKEKQREQIDLLKRDESFEVTRKLIDKYESDTARRDYFSKLRQQERGMLDNVADIVLGQDPSSMYALICKKCHYHNGLVHPSEYGLTDFYCYNCSELNVRSDVRDNPCNK